MTNRKKLVMKTKISFIAAILVVASFAIGRATADRNPQLHQQTIDNLMTAAHGEAFAYAKYMLYAQRARDTGRPDLADVFERAATMSASSTSRMRQNSLA